MSELSYCCEYLSFRNNVPLATIFVDSKSEKGWKIYDSGPKTVTSPLICLAPACGTADIFFKQVLGLNAKGIRVITAEHPAYWSIDEWCIGFEKLLDNLGLDKVHIFGASLGGFLAQKFAEYTSNCPRVASLILCNTFVDTSIFNSEHKSKIFWVLPSLVLKKMILVKLPYMHHDKNIIDSVDFMVEKLDSLSQSDLASRLTINAVNSYVKPYKLSYLSAITIIDVFDDHALHNMVKEQLKKYYPNAKLALLKTGGNFPYLSRSEEVNLYIQIHLRQFQGTEYSAQDE